MSNGIGMVETDGPFQGIGYADLESVEVIYYLGRDAYDRLIAAGIDVEKAMDAFHGWKRGQDGYASWDVATTAERLNSFFLTQYSAYAKR